MKKRKAPIVTSTSMAWATLVLILAFSSTFKVHVLAQEEPPLSDWYDPEGLSPMTYTEWLRTLPPAEPFSLTLNFSRGGSHSTILIIVNQETADVVFSNRTAYVYDLLNEGHQVWGYVWRGSLGDAISLRTRLRTIYRDTPFDGIVFVGRLPVAWFENHNDYGGEYADFPIDLYWMDMDGAWHDTDLNQKFDLHTDGDGDVAPEVWMGRLTAFPLSWDDPAREAELLYTYFQKNNDYRTGRLRTNHRALVYVDDDFDDYPYQYSPEQTHLSRVYANVETVTDELTTIAEDYRNRVHYGYEFLHLIAHSSPRSHTWKYPLETGEHVWDGSFLESEIPTEDPQFIFYNLVCCSNARYIESRYMAGRYIFDTALGLAAIGSTKSGGMHYWCNRFYSPFAGGKTIGESFLNWFQVVGSDGYDARDTIMFYGLTLLGDPTLKSSVHTWPMTFVGGTTIPIDRPAPPAPYFDTTSAILVTSAIIPVATVAATIYAKHIKHRKEEK